MRPTEVVLGMIGLKLADRITPGICTGPPRLMTTRRSNHRLRFGETTSPSEGKPQPTEVNRGTNSAIRESSQEGQRGTPINKRYRSASKELMNERPGPEIKAIRKIRCSTRRRRRGSAQPRCSETRCLESSPDRTNAENQWTPSSTEKASKPSSERESGAKAALLLLSEALKLSRERESGANAAPIQYQCKSFLVHFNKVGRTRHIRKSGRMPSQRKRRWLESRPRSPWKIQAPYQEK